jgi:nicotinamidase-related amidase
LGEIIGIKNMRRFRQLSQLAACLMVLVSPVASSAQSIIDEWSAVKAPPAPELKDVSIDPRTTALLMLDFVKQNCNEKVRPRCPATLPAAKQLLAGARANSALVIYGIVTGSVIGDTMGDVAPNGNEPVVQSGPDKFLNTDLEKILKDRGIRTVIVAGTAANGAVLHTASEAVLRGFKAVVPVDTMSADNAYIEQYVAYHFISARGGIAAGTTLTRVGMVKY